MPGAAWLLLPALDAADVAVIVTDHAAYDYAEIVARARLLVDTRNATKDVTAGRGRIVLA